MVKPVDRATDGPSMRRLLVLIIGILTASPLAAGSASAAGPAAAGAAPEWQCEAEICQRLSRRGEFLSIEVKSARKSPTWVQLDPIDLSNVKPLDPPPYLFRLEPGEQRTAGILAIQDPTKPFGYQTRWRTLAGNPNAVHDDRWHYRMPFGGARPIPISQGYKGKFSHKGLGAYALDFPMPWGTPILASRGGVIVEVINDRVASGIRTGESEGDNRVVIEHVDGTFAIYAHLRHGGPARVGRRVESGELIGLSGDTGFSTGPHLHFEVFKVLPDGRHQTIPVRFWDGTRQGFTALAGLQYKPGCPRDGGSMCLPGELASERRSRPAERPPAAAAPSGGAPFRRADGACVCPNRAVLHVDLPCERVCGR